MDIDLQNRLLNHVRLRQLLARGDKRLQEIFRKRWIIYRHADWRDGDGKELLSLCGTALPGVKDALTNQSIDSWDITAASYGIKIISIEIQKNGGTAAAKEDKTIALLRNFRNDFSHGKNDYSNVEFNKKWNEVATYLVSLGDNYDDIKKLKADLMELGKHKVEDVVEAGDAKNSIDKKLDGSGSVPTVFADFEENDQSKNGTVTETIYDKNDAIKKSVSCSTSVEKCEAVKFLEKGDKLLKADEYKNSIEAYTDSLQYPGLNTEEKAHIFVNRSTAYLMLNRKDFYQLAKKDAEWAIQFWPSWWKGYYLLGQANFKLEELYEAEKALNNAYVLNPGSKDVRDELHAVKHKIGVITREDHLKPENQLPTSSDQIKDIHTRLGISKKQAKKLTNKVSNLPNASDILKANNYMLGRGVPQNFTKAANFFERAAINGNPSAMYNLGKLLLEGSGVKQNFGKAMEWLMKAATTEPSANGLVDDGVAYAQHTIGMNYHQGIGVTKDYKKAVEWYQKSMNNGYHGAASNLGMMYKNGEGVPRNSEKAFKLFKYAAMAGDTQGMVNLGSCYLIGEGTGSSTVTEEDIAEGKKWYKIAADKGNLQAAQELKIRENYTTEHAKLQQLGELLLSGAENKSNPLNKQQHKKDVKEAARKGSTTAQRLVDIWKNMDAAMEAFKSNDSDALVAALSKAIQIEPQIVEIPELLKSVVESKIKEPPNDLNTIICYVHLDDKRPEFPEIMHKYFTMFPENEYFLEMRITSFIEMEMVEKALIVADKALELYPKSVRFLYCRAMALFSMDNNNSEAVEKFLAAVPKDNEKLPGCHYRKAMHFYNIGNISKFMQSYEAAISAEAKQLPCFLPYDYPQKHLLDRLYEHHKNQRENKTHGSKGIIPFTHKLEEIKDNPERKLLITRQRHVISTQTFLNESARFGEPPEKADVPSLVSLKKITLQDMDPCQDKPYNGYVLEAKIIDWPILLNSIVTIIEDENGDLQRLAVHNWPTKGSKILDIIETLKSFRPNTLVSIINPHFRQSSDQGTAIHVEHPSYIRINNFMAENKCCCCGKEGKSMPACSKCLMSRYCSAECQRFDWKELCHSKVCDELKKYSKYF